MTIHTATTAAVGALAALMLVASPISASATPVSVDAASAQCGVGLRLVHVWSRVPEELRADLKELASLDRGERADAAREIRDSAQAGEYGAGVQDRAEHRAGKRLRLVANLPAGLEADLAEARAAAPVDRPELAEAIREKAVAGEYGKKAKTVAERVQDSAFWQECAAK